MRNILFFSFLFLLIGNQVVWSSSPDEYSQVNGSSISPSSSFESPSSSSLESYEFISKKIISFHQYLKAEDIKYNIPGTDRDNIRKEYFEHIILPVIRLQDKLVDDLRSKNNNNIVDSLGLIANYSAVAYPYEDSQHLAAMKGNIGTWRHTLCARSL